MTDINREEIYQLAVEMMNDGNNTENVLLKTAEAFETLGDYKDSKELALKCIEKADEAAKNSVYKAGLEKMQGNDISDYEEAIELFSKISEWNDATDKIAECKRKIEEIKDKAEKERIEKCNNTIKEDAYKNALLLYENGNIFEAYKSMLGLGEYKDCKKKASEFYKQYLLEQLNGAHIGSNIFFGTYEQDNDISNGKESIEWTVLAKDGNKLLIISKQGLDCQRYNETEDDVTWSSCTLRTWLNSTFVNEAFNNDEKGIIQPTKVVADENPNFYTPAGSDTTDKVFLLSLTEVNKYIPNNSSRKCKPTPYAVAQGAFDEYDEGTGNCIWWLRTPGETPVRIVAVDSVGSIGIYGEWSTVLDPAVRPAIWIDISNL